MTNLNVPNAVTNGTVADATDIQQNFDAIETHVNTEVINRDGGVAMTGELLLPSNPTSNLAAATKSYVDLQVGNEESARITAVSNEATTRANADTALDGRVTTLEGKDIVITLTGDVTGTGTITNLTDVSFATTVVDDLHNHVTSNIDGLDAALAARVTTTYNSSLNSDSRNSRGVTRLYRRDSNDDYSVQTWWDGSRWMLEGYQGDNYHAGVRVGYADYAATAGSAGSATNATNATNAGNADTVDTLHGSQFLRSDTSDTASGRITFSAAQGNANWDNCQIVVSSSGNSGISIRSSNSNTNTVQLRSGSSPISGRAQLYLRTYLNAGGCDLSFSDTFSDTGYMYVANSINKIRIKSDAAGYPWAELECGTLGVNGAVWVNGGQVHSSSRDIKHDITPIGAGALNLVNSLQPVNYRYNDFPDDLHSGFIAEDLELVFPDAVMRHEDRVGIEQSTLLATVVAAVQELSAQVAALQG